MVYESDEHGRRSIRLKGYDYASEGAYFVTICTKEKVPYFDMYPELRVIIRTEWEALAGRFPTMIADTFVVMPNHVHAVIALGASPTNVGATLAVAQRAGASPAVAQRAGATLAVAQRAGASPAPTVGTIVGAYKSLCEKSWLKHLKEIGSDAAGRIWQRNYYEHVVRNEEELNLIRQYIASNPSKWSFDFDNQNHIPNQEYSEHWGWLESGKRAGTNPASAVGSAGQQAFRR